MTKCKLFVVKVEGNLMNMRSRTEGHCADVLHAGHVSTLNEFKDETRAACACGLGEIGFRGLSFNLLFFWHII